VVGVPPGRRVDLVSKKYLHKMLRDPVLPEAVVLYAACRRALEYDDFR